jgi:hypothetical protein
VPVISLHVEGKQQHTHPITPLEGASELPRVRTFWVNQQILTHGSEASRYLCIAWFHASNVHLYLAVTRMAAWTAAIASHVRRPAGDG